MIYIMSITLRSPKLWELYTVSSPSYGDRCGILIISRSCLNALKGTRIPIMMKGRFLSIKRLWGQHFVGFSEDRSDAVCRVGKIYR